MKILFVLDEFLPTTAAPSVRIHNLLSEFEEKQVTVIGGITGESNLRGSNFETILIERPEEKKCFKFLFFLLKLWVKTIKVTRKEKFDVIVLSIPKYESLVIFPFLKKRTDLLVLDIRDSLRFLDYTSYLQHKMPGFLAKPLGSIIKIVISYIQNKAVKKADLITTANIGIKNSLVNLQDKTHVISNGVDVSLFKPEDTKLSSDEVINLVYLGNFSEKDLFSPVETLDKFLKSKINLHLIGGGRNKDKVLARLKSNDLKVIDHGLIKHADLPEILNKMTIGFIFRKDEVDESIPVAIYEFASMGLPVICNNVGIMAEIVDKQGLGYIVRDNYSLREILEAQLKKAFSMEDKLRLHNKARDCFSLKSQAMEFKKLIYSVLEK